LRTTAVPTGRPTAKASSGSSAAPTRALTRTTPRRARRPRAARAAKPARDRTRPMRTGGRSGRQAEAALLAAGAEHRPPRPGAHPVTEAVPAGPLPVVGLVRPLHRWVSGIDRGAVARERGAPVARRTATVEPRRPVRQSGRGVGRPAVHTRPPGIHREPVENPLTSRNDHGKRPLEPTREATATVLDPGGSPTGNPVDTPFEHGRETREGRHRSASATGPGHGRPRRLGCASTGCGRGCGFG
jgi:hypothetical protein